MIKVDATLVGTVKRGALLRNKDGKNYLSYVLIVNVPAGEGSHKAMEVIMSDKDTSSNYKEGSRLLVNGSLDIRKRDDELAFYLSSEKVTEKDVPADDSIGGELKFRGRLKNDDVCETKEDKNGRTYLLFNGYSSEKVGENGVAVVVRAERNCTALEGSVALCEPVVGVKFYVVVCDRCICGNRLADHL